MLLRHLVFFLLQCGGLFPGLLVLLLGCAHLLLELIPLFGQGGGGVIFLLQLVCGVGVLLFLFRQLLLHGVFLFGDLLNLFLLFRQLLTQLLFSRDFGVNLFFTGRDLLFKTGFGILKRFNLLLE